MKKKYFDPKKFIDDFKKDTGLTTIDKDEALSYIENPDSSLNDKYLKNPSKFYKCSCVANAYAFAIATGDREKLNQCLENAKYLADSCPQKEKYTELLRVIFNQIFITKKLYDIGKLSKRSAQSFREKELKKYEKSEVRYLNKIRRAIETFKSHDLDVLKFDEAYILELAKRKFIDDCLSKPRCSEYHGALRKRHSVKNGGLKRDIHIQHFVWNTHDLLKRYKLTLTDSAICTCLASLLTIITNNKKSRQNVQNYLKRKPEYLKNSVTKE